MNAQANARAQRQRASTRMAIAAAVATCAGGAVSCAFPSAAEAQAYTPTQSLLVTQTDVTPGFGGGGTINSIKPAAGGALVQGDLNNIVGGTSMSFSRWAMQKINFNSDLSAFNSFDVTIESLSPNVTGVKLFIQTGSDFLFVESPFVNLTPGTPVLVSRDFHNPVDVPNTNNVRQFGFQFFGPAGSFTNQAALVLPTNVAPPSGDATWGTPNSGDWNDIANWSTLMIPNAVDAKAVFGNAISAPRTVFTDTNVSLGQMVFSGTNTYDVTGNGVLSMDVTSGSATIDVQAGSQKINLPLSLQDSTAANVATGATLTIADPTTLAGGTTLSKNGPGTLNVLSTINAPAPATIKINGGVANLAAANSSPNISVNVDPATLNIGANQTLGSMSLSLGGNVLNVGRDTTGANVPAKLTVSDLHVTGGGAANVVNQTLAGNTLSVTGSLEIQAGSKLQKTGPGVLKMGSLSVDATGQLDLTNGKAIVDYSGGSPGAAIRTAIISGRAGGAWTGNGITSSTAAADASTSHKTAVGYGEASTIGVGSFGGETVDTTAVLVRYTYAGDANLDGKVDTLDFNSLAGNFGGSGKVWTQADFNYDGVVDTLDFNNLAANFGQQIAEGGGGVGALVPEPAAMSLLALGASALISRRRNRRGTAT